MSWSVGFLPVDDYGRVLGESALRVLVGLGHPVRASEVDAGPERFRRTGTVLLDAELELLKNSDAVFVGAPAVTAPGVPRGVLERGVVFRLRSELDLYVNLRAFAGTGPAGALDIAVVRENTEGGYIGEGGILRRGTPHAIATQGSVTTTFGVERCLRYAFELASHRRQIVTLVHKANVLEFAGQLWVESFERIAAAFPGVQSSYVDIDTACVLLVQNPAQFDVMVTDNLFGDIVSDLVGALACGLDRSGSADLNPSRTGPSLFEPLHANAALRRTTPLDRIDPRGAFAAVALMLEHLGEAESAQALARAVRAVEPDRALRLRDIELAVLRACHTGI